MFTSFDRLLPPAARVSLAVCIAYACTSMILALVNKALLSSYGFPCYFILLSTQLGISYLFCVISRDYLGNPFSVAPFSWATARAAFPMGIMYVLNVGFGLVGLQLVNVPMFFCIRRLVSPIILLVEFITLKKVADSGTQFAVSLIVLGTLLAGYESLSTELLGYALTFANNVCTAAASILQKSFSETSAAQSSGKTSTFTIVYYNSVIALPLSIIFAIFWGEFTSLAEFPYLENSGFWGGFITASSMGLLLTYTSMLCTTYNSPLATSVTGNVKDIATTALGWMMFGGFNATVTSVSGLFVAFVGAFIYSYIGLSKSRANAAAPTSSSTSTAATSSTGNSSMATSSQSSSTSVDSDGASNAPSDVDENDAAAVKAALLQLYHAGEGVKRPLHYPGVITGWTPATQYRLKTEDSHSNSGSSHNGVNHVNATTLTDGHTPDIEQALRFPLSRSPATGENIGNPTASPPHITNHSVPSIVSASAKLTHR